MEEQVIGHVALRACLFRIKGGSYILPFLQAQLYDANTHPTAFKRSIVL